METCTDMSISKGKHNNQNMCRRQTKLLENDLKIFKDQINPEIYNGATLIGLNGISIKSHGSASPFAFSCAIKKCFDFIDNDLNLKIINNFRDL